MVEHDLLLYLMGVGRLVEQLNVRILHVRHVRPNEMNRHEIIVRDESMIFWM